MVTVLNVRCDEFSAAAPVQGRMRPGLADLFRWRDPGLKDLPFVDKLVEYKQAVPGYSLILFSWLQSLLFCLMQHFPGGYFCSMRHDFQFINVDPGQGEGESTPSPFFYQNLQEAEYVVALYMYLRLVGYVFFRFRSAVHFLWLSWPSDPSDSFPLLLFRFRIPSYCISILTPYNGQKYLLRDVFSKRCGWTPFFGSVCLFPSQSPVPHCLVCLTVLVCLSLSPVSRHASLLWTSFKVNRMTLS